MSPLAETGGPITLVGGDAGGEGENTNTKSYWDMLIDLIDPSKVDLMIRVFLDECYVLKIPNPESATVLQMII